MGSLDKQVRGVNFGGWLVLEKWITPTLFKDCDADDEFGFMQHVGAAERIKKHRDTFITEQDFIWLSQHGINLVRIPVGYWLFEPIDGFLPTVSYLDQAMTWAAKHNIQVLIDMHGAPGSQNGKDHSGKKGKAMWFTNNNQQTTAALLCKIAERYKDSPALWGIELLNEPKVLGSYFRLIWFYRRMYAKLRKIVKPGTAIVFHDGFHSILFSLSLWPRKNYPVYMDCHWYAFIPVGNSLHRYLKLLSIYRKLLLRYVQLFQPVIVGEWSSVLPGRYFDQIPQDQHDELLRKNIDMQLDAYKNAAGWIYWNYKHEGRGMWNFRSLIDEGIFDKIKS